MFPYSDIENVLYYLWDMGFDVGHCYRTVQHCIDEMQKDLKTCTALIETHIVLGSKKLYKEFSQGVDEYIAQKCNADNFVRAKIEELNSRHGLYGKSPTFLEPDIKESPGGLRDYHTSLWLAKTKLGIKGYESLTSILSCEEWEEYYEAVNNLLQVRAKLHLLKNKKNDVISKEDWILLSQSFDLSSEVHSTEAKNFVRKYYLSTKNILYYSNLIIDECKEITKEKKTRKELAGGFYIEDNEICFSYGEEFHDKDPAFLIDVFYYAQIFNVSIDRRLWRDIRSFLKKTQPDISNNSYINKIFLFILSGMKSYEIIRAIYDIGLLNYIIPEFRAVESLSEFDPFHEYTVDEHSMMALKHFEALDSETEVKGFSDVYQELKNSVTLKLAILMHDIGKGNTKNHPKVGAEITRTVLERWEIGKRKSEDVVYLVENHILMSKIAQHYDIEDKKIISDFSESVKEERRLKMLLLLTCSDIKAVGKETWNAWKGTLLFELFISTLGYLSDSFHGKNLLEYKAKILNSLKGEIPEDVIVEHLDNMPPKYINLISMEKIEWEIRAVNKLEYNEVVFLHRINNNLGCSEFVVCTKKSYPGLFSEITGVILSEGLNILGANVCTRKDGVVVDLIQVQDGGIPIINDTLVKSIDQKIQKVLKKEVNVNSLMSGERKFTLSRPSFVCTKVAVDNEASEKYTVIQITTQEQRGILYSVSSAMFHLGLDIATAKIVTEGDRVIDTFYISFENEKIVDKYMLKSICMFLVNSVDSQNIYN